MEKPIENIKRRMLETRKDMISYEILFKQHHKSTQLQNELGKLYLQLNMLYEIYQLEMSLTGRSFLSNTKEFKLSPQENDVINLNKN